MEDATKLWWNLSPSARYPTLEMRIGDACTRLDDAMAVAALTQWVISMLYRLRSNNQRWRVYPRIMVHENRWRAQRYDVGDSLVDFGKGELVPYAELLDELIHMVREGAERLGCVAEVEHTSHIAANGTSADRQRRAFETVVDFLIEETVLGLD